MPTLIVAADHRDSPVGPPGEVSILVEISPQPSPSPVCGTQQCGDGELGATGVDAFAALSLGLALLVGGLIAAVVGGARRRAATGSRDDVA